MKAKLESKVAKTTVQPTAVVTLSMSPAMVFYIMGGVFPSSHSHVNFRLLEAPTMMLYSVANPILYCYRNRRFRNVVLELLQIGKSRKTVAADCTVRYDRRKYRIDEAEDVLKLQNVGIPATCLLILFRFQNVPMEDHAK